jgi:hypothetical protein
MQNKILSKGDDRTRSGTAGREELSGQSSLGAELPMSEIEARLRRLEERLARQERLLQQLDEAVRSQEFRLLRALAIDAPPDGGAVA